MTTSEYSRKNREILAVCLATVAGYVDAYGFLTFSTFVSFMSGNTTHAGYNIGLGLYHAALPAALAIISFVAGVFSGTLLTRSRARRSRRALYSSITSLIALYIIASHLGAVTTFPGIVLLSFTMGVMNTALSRVGKQTVNLTFVTGTLSQIGGHLALAARREPLGDGEGAGDTHLRRALMLSVIWTGFLGGAVLGGLATSLLREWMLVIPLLIMLTLALIGQARYAED
ncbi:MAG TPA: YoaK family protein [Thermodesulfobacteriota bacterium]|nr:YoaK family protein [Thermodesulfobacteriota bacterium]